MKSNRSGWKIMEWDRSGIDVVGGKRRGDGQASDLTANKSSFILSLYICRYFFFTVSLSLSLFLSP